jgi:hypothetical protein
MKWETRAHRHKWIINSKYFIHTARWQQFEDKFIVTIVLDLSFEYLQTG